MMDDISGIFVEHPDSGEIRKKPQDCGSEKSSVSDQSFFDLIDALMRSDKIHQQL
jgi:hypothetical protein